MGDPHGNVQVAKIESERLLGALLDSEMTARRRAGKYNGTLSLQYHYFGYEGRCPPPSAFDANYCLSLGLAAGALISAGCTGMMACLQARAYPPLSSPPSHTPPCPPWRPLLPTHPLGAPSPPPSRPRDSAPPYPCLGGVMGAGAHPARQLLVGQGGAAHVHDGRRASQGQGQAGDP